MIYLFQCETKECSEYHQPVEKRLLMTDRDLPQYCSECYEPMSRVFTAPATSTSDGFKK